MLLISIPDRFTMDYFVWSYLVTLSKIDVTTLIDTVVFDARSIQLFDTQSIQLCLMHKSKALQPTTCTKSLVAIATPKKN